MGRTFKEVTEYVEWQNHGAGKVLSAKPEHHFRLHLKCEECDQPMQIEFENTDE